MTDSRPLLDVSFTSYDAAALWAAARDVAARLEQQTAKEPAIYSLGWLSAILLAAISVEAFLNQLAEQASESGHDDQVARALADALVEAEESRASIRLKLLTAGLALGTPIDKGRQPYQDFDLLFQVRDAIAHLKVHRQTFTKAGKLEEPDRLLKRLHQRGVLPGLADPSARGFLDRITTPAVCSWSVEAARAIIAHVAGLIPEGDLRRSVASQLGNLMLPATKNARDS